MKLKLSSIFFNIATFTVALGIFSNVPWIVKDDCGDMILYFGIALMSYGFYAVLKTLGETK